MFLTSSEHALDVTEDGYDIQWGTNILGAFRTLSSWNMSPKLKFARSLLFDIPPGSCLDCGSKDLSGWKGANYLYGIDRSNWNYQLGRFDRHTGKKKDVPR